MVAFFGKERRTDVWNQRYNASWGTFCISVDNASSSLSGIIFAPLTVSRFSSLITSSK